MCLIEHFGLGLDGGEAGGLCGRMGPQRPNHLGEQNGHKATCDESIGNIGNHKQRPRFCECRTSRERNRKSFIVVVVVALTIKIKPNESHRRVGLLGDFT